MSCEINKESVEKAIKKTIGYQLLDFNIDDNIYSSDESTALDSIDYVESLFKTPLFSKISNNSWELKIPSTLIDSYITNSPVVNSENTYLKNTYFKNSDTVKVYDLLESIIDNNGPLSPLAFKLKEYSYINNVDVHLRKSSQSLGLSAGLKKVVVPDGSFLPVQNEIEINKYTDRPDQLVDSLLIHEILHAFTNKFLLNNPSHPVVSDLQDVLSYLRTNDKIINKYPLSNLDELVVGFFTNSQFIYDLQKMNAINKYNNYDNLFQELIHYMLDLFGLSYSSKSLYEELFPLFTNTIEASKDYFDITNNVSEKYSDLYSLQEANSNKILAETALDGTDAVVSINQSPSDKTKYQLLVQPKNRLTDLYARAYNGKTYRSLAVDKTITTLVNKLTSLFPNFSIKEIDASQLIQSEHEPSIDTIKSFIKEDTVYLVRERYDMKDTIEELLHPFVLGMDRGLFQEIFEENKQKYISTFNLYYTKGLSTAKSEVVTKAIRDAIIEKSNKSWLQNVLEYIADSFKKMFGVNINKVEDIANALYSQDNNFFTAQITSDPYYSLDDKQQRVKDGILKSVKNPGFKKSKSGAFYTLDDKKIARVSDIVQLENNLRKEEKGVELTDVVETAAMKAGTIGHSVIEDIIKRATDPITNIRYNTREEVLNNKRSDIDVPTGVYDSIENYILDVIFTYPDGVMLLPETLLLHKTKSVRLTKKQKKEGYSNKGLAGTIDFIAILPSGDIDIKDFKFLTSKNKESISNEKRKEYNIQLSEYIGLIKENTGLTNENIKSAQIVPFFIYHNDEIDDLKILLVETPSIDLSKITQNRLFPYNANTANSKKIETLISKLRNLPLIYSKIESIITGEVTYENAEDVEEVEDAISKLIQSDDTFDGNFEKIIDIHDKMVNELTLFIRNLRNISKNDIDKSSVLEITNKLKLASTLAISLSEFRVAAEFVFGESNAKVINKDTDAQVKQRIATTSLNIQNATESLEKALEEVFTKIGKSYGITNITKPELEIKNLTSYTITSATPPTHITSLFKLVTRNMGTIIDKNRNAGLAKLREISYNLKDTLPGNQLVNFLLDIDPITKKKTLKSVFKSNFTSDKKGILLTGTIKSMEEWFSKYYDLDKYRAFKDELIQKKIDRFKETNPSDEDLNAEINKLKQIHDIRISKIAYSRISNQYLKIHDTQLVNDYYTDFGKNLLKNQPAMDLYNHIVSLNKKLLSSGLLPRNKNFNVYEFYPMATSSLMQRLKEEPVSNYWKVIKHSIKDSLVIKGDENLYTGKYNPITETLEKTQFMPFVQDIFEDDYTDQSTDIFKVIGAYQSALEAVIVHKEYIPFAETSLNFEKTKKVIPRAKYGGPLKMFSKGERTDFTPINSDANYSFAEAMFDAQLYGGSIKESSDYKFKVPGIQEEVSLAKVFQTVRNTMYANTFGLAIFTPIRQYITGSKMSRLVSGKHMLASDLESFDAFIDGLTGSVENYSTSKKLKTALLGYLMPFANQENRKQVNDLSFNKLANWLSPEKLIFLNKSDEMVQIKLIYGLMKNTIIKDGKLMNVRTVVSKEFSDFYNQVEVDGRISSVKIKELNKKVNDRIKELLNTNGLLTQSKIENGKLVIPGIDMDDVNSYVDFRLLAQDYGTKVTGMLPEHETQRIRNTLVGQLISTYRSWIPRTVQVRVGQVKYNALSMDYEWGRWLMYWDYVTHEKDGMAINALKNFSSSIFGLQSKEDMIIYAKEKYLSLLDKLQKEGRLLNDEEFMSEKDFIDQYMLDVQSTAAELQVIIGLMTVLMMLALSPSDDDDEYEKNMKSFARFQVDRMYNEFSFYISPSSFSELTKNAVPIIAYVDGYLKIGRDIMSNILGIGANIIGFEEIGDELIDFPKTIKDIMKMTPYLHEGMKYMPFYYPELAKELNIRPIKITNF